MDNKIIFEMLKETRQELKELRDEVKSLARVNIAASVFSNFLYKAGSVVAVILASIKYFEGKQ
jgi:hypothetical protein